MRLGHHHPYRKDGKTHGLYVVTKHYKTLKKTETLAHYSVELKFQIITAI